MASSLLNDPDFIYVKNSIDAINDNNKEFREELIEYINDSSSNSSDMFFYDMLEFVRFLKPDSQTTAYTSPDHLIFMNAPSCGPLNIGKNHRQWDFIYDHECLHQLWDTFAVADQIKAKGIEFNMQILNIASDVVINDYLSFYRKKDMPNGICTPESIKEMYDVEYDRKVDTQFTLYMKFMKKKEELMKDPNFRKMMEEQRKSQQQSQGGQGQDPTQGQNPKQGQDDQCKDGQCKNGQCQGQGKPSQGQGKPGQGQGGQSTEGEGYVNGYKDAKEGKPYDPSSATKGKSGQEKRDAEDGYKKGYEDGEKGNSEGAGYVEGYKDAEEGKPYNPSSVTKGKSGKEKRDAEEGYKKGYEDAKSSQSGNSNDSGEGNGKEDDNGNGSNKNGPPSAGRGHVSTKNYIDAIRKKAEERLKKYRNKIAGPLGEFIRKCNSSSKCEDTETLKRKVTSGSVSWNKQLFNEINAYVKQRVQEKRRQWEPTYQRMKRGAGFVKMGQPIERGIRRKQDTMILNTAFFTDRSGSMGECKKGTPLWNAFSATYEIATAIEHDYLREPTISDIHSDFYSFDDDIEKLPFNKIPDTGGGTLPMIDIFKYIEKHSADYMVNIIISDGGFSGIDESQVESYLKKFDGIFIIICNTPVEQCKDLAKRNRGKFIYIEADYNFSVK